LRARRAPATIEGDEGKETGAQVGAEAAEGMHVFSEEAGDVLEYIPNDSAAARLLLERSPGL
jgi:hypothetical protein